MVAIYCRKKNVKVKQAQLDIVLYHLKQCGVHIDYAVHERHGHYNQLHTHCMVRYNKKYKSLTSYGNIEYDGYDFKIHWTPLFNHYGCMMYLEKTFGHIVADISSAI